MRRDAPLRMKKVRSCATLLGATGGKEAGGSLVREEPAGEFGPEPPRSTPNCCPREGEHA